MRRRTGLFRGCSLLAVFLAAACQPKAGTAPQPPGSVQAELNNLTAHVSWAPTGGDITEFVIARAIVPLATSTPAQTELKIIGSAKADATSFDDPDLEKGRFYVYAVAARGPGGRSDFTLQGGEAVTLTPAASACAAHAPTATDSDGDGLSDVDEESGWQVMVDESGQGTPTARAVRSDPFSADTDSDGVCDREESALKLDPRQADTDGDGLSDGEELSRWGSSPTNVDSDQDAHGNSAFYDGAELLNYGTSPTLADTDGDGRTDYEELNQNGTNPLVAELPQPKLELVGPVDLGIHVMTSTGTTLTNAATQSFAQASTNTLAKTSSTANTQTTESSFEITTEASAGFPASASVSASGTYSEKAGYVQETSSSVSRQAQLSSEQTYQALSSQLIEQDQTVTGGHLAVDFQIQNVGTRTFQLSSVVVTALRRDPANPASFTSIATLSFPASANDLVLAEGQSAGPIRAEADISGNVALDLLANPGAIFFRTANFQLIDRTGEAFQFSIGEATSSRTALLTIDYGGVRPLERFRVATNVERTSDGKAAGVQLKKALEQMIGLAPGLGYQTTERANTGKRVLTRVRDVETTAKENGGVGHFWVVIAPENPDANLGPVSDRLLSKIVDFEDAVLMPKDSLTLAWVADQDGDGLYDREELTWGTWDGDTDSDDDGLTDFEEVRQGWTVTVDSAFYQAHPRVFSNPTAADADDDGWTDAVEKQHGTDPNRKDTDGDGIADSSDPEPTQGPVGTWVKVLGTSGDDTALQVLADRQTVWVLGESTGDIDGDGQAGGPFVMALDPVTGDKQWAVQLEGSTNFSRKLVVTTEGIAHWMTEVRAGALPGASTHALHLVHLTRAGVVSATDLTNVPYGGATTLANQVCGSQEPAPGGGLMTINGYTAANGAYGVQVYSFDATGSYSGGVGTHRPGDPPQTIVASASAGLLTVYSARWTGGCEVSFYRGTTGVGTTPYCTGFHPESAGRVALDHLGAAYVQAISGSKDKLDRITLAGNTVWSRTFAPDFTTPRITGLDVDDTDNLFIGVQDVGAGVAAGLEILRPDQSRQVLLRLGNASTRLISTRRDPVGNVFTLGSTTGGFETFAQNHGGVDLVLTRNPQVTFAP